MAKLFEGLTAIVQYRRPAESGVYDPWHNMAAFDLRHVAEEYAAKCANETWEYQVVDVPESDEE